MDRGGMLVTPRFRGRDFEVDPNLVFVLIPFREPFIRILEDHIKKVAEELGLICRKADDIFAPREIMEDIWEQINRARFIIADLTDKNPNVFYEVGIAHTLGKDVILITQSKDDVPFDLHYIRYIYYEYTPPGMQHFEKALKQTIEELLSGASIADLGLLEAQAMLKQHFIRWKRVGLLPSFEIYRMITAYGDQLADVYQLSDVLDNHKLAFMLRVALWYGQDVIYWAEKNRKNEEIVPILLDTLRGRERRPLYRVGLVIEYLSPPVRGMVIDQAQKQLADNEKVALVLEKAKMGETLKFWESELPESLDPGKAKELIHQAKTSKRLKHSSSSNNV